MAIRWLWTVTAKKRNATSGWFLSAGEGDTLQAGKPEPFINGPADEINPSFSPDGKWLAYASDKTGTFTVYVRSLKNPGATWQISTEEGYMPEWSPRGMWGRVLSVKGNFGAGRVEAVWGRRRLPGGWRSADIYHLSTRQPHRCAAPRKRGRGRTVTSQLHFDARFLR